MKLIVANWKANPATLEEALDLASRTDRAGVVIMPPFHFIPGIRPVLKSASLGAQDIFWEDLGAYTGEISWRHLQNCGVTWAIIGHSERRKYLGETDEMVNKKIQAALTNGFKGILCVGESAEIRKSGLNAAKSFVADQLQKALLGIDSKLLSNLIIAYEPLWAIGTGNPDTPESAAAMAQFVKLTLQASHQVNVPVIYGGSVNAANAKSFLDHPAIDGALVGGASLKADDFNAIAAAA